jgi:poly(A) polymerase
VLRFFRFFAWYGKGEPDAAGLKACADLKAGIATLSAERISVELLKLLGAGDPRPAVRLMAETGVLAQVLPELGPIARFEAMVEIDADPLLRLSALLPDDDAAVMRAAEHLRLSNAQRERLLAALLPETPEVGPGLDQRQARAAIYRLGARVFRDRLKRAWAEQPQAAPEAGALLDYVEGWDVPRFPLGGADVLAAGVPLGPEVGRLLREVEAWWIEHDFPEHGALDRLRALVKRP